MVELVVCCVVSLVCVLVVLVRVKCWLILMWMLLCLIRLNSLLVIVWSFFGVLVQLFRVGWVMYSEFFCERMFRLILVIGFEVLLKLISKLCGVMQFSEVFQVFLFIELQIIGYFFLLVSLSICCVMFLWLQLMVFQVLCCLVRCVFFGELMVLISCILRVLVY